MIPRTLINQAQKLATWFPVVSVTGPRQSGKSTLVRHAFPDYEYINLESEQVRRLAQEDPVGFIRNRPAKLIIDEAQHVPELFSEIQVVSDLTNKPGQYILSGSQNFLLLKNITQSLAGRVGLLKLLPLSFKEALQAKPTLTADEFMFSGGFPRLYDTGLPERLLFSNYVETYVQRVVSDYLDVRNLASFRKFLELCALNVGNLTNYSNLANDADISPLTAKSWLSILESSYVAFELMPYHSSARTRLTKTPKLYFYDTGLLCYLLGITSLEELLLSEHLGAVYENLIIGETLKDYFNQTQEPRLCFYRDASGREIDLIDESRPREPMLVEIKSSETYHDRFAKHLRAIGDELGVPSERRHVVSRVADSYVSKGVPVSSARDWLLR